MNQPDLLVSIREQSLRNAAGRSSTAETTHIPSASPPSTTDAEWIARAERAIEFFARRLEDRPVPAPTSAVPVTTPDAKSTETLDAVCDRLADLETALEVSMQRTSDEPVIDTLEVVVTKLDEFSTLLRRLFQGSETQAEDSGDDTAAARPAPETDPAILDALADIHARLEELRSNAAEPVANDEAEEATDDSDAPRLVDVDDLTSIIGDAFAEHVAANPGTEASQADPRLDELLSLVTEVRVANRSSQDAVPVDPIIEGVNERLEAIAIAVGEANDNDEASRESIGETTARVSEKLEEIEALVRASADTEIVLDAHAISSSVVDALDLDALEQSMSTLRENVESLFDATTSTTPDASSDSLQATISALESSVGEIRSEIEDVRAAVNENANAAKSVSDDLLESIREQLASQSARSEDVESLQPTIEALTEEIRALKLDVETSLAAMDGVDPEDDDDANRAIAEIGANLEQLRSDMQNEISSIREAVSDAAESKDGSASEVAELRRDLERWMSELRSANEEDSNPDALRDLEQRIDDGFARLVEDHEASMDADAIREWIDEVAQRVTSDVSNAIQPESAAAPLRPTDVEAAVGHALDNWWESRPNSSDDDASSISSRLDELAASVADVRDELKSRAESANEDDDSRLFEELSEWKSELEAKLDAIGSGPELDAESIRSECRSAVEQCLGPVAERLEHLDARLATLGSNEPEEGLAEVPETLAGLRRDFALLVHTLDDHMAKTREFTEAVAKTLRESTGATNLEQLLED